MWCGAKQGTQTWPGIWCYQQRPNPVSRQEPTEGIDGGSPLCAQDDPHQTWMNRINHFPLVSPSLTCAVSSYLRNAVNRFSFEKSLRITYASAWFSQTWGFIANSAHKFHPEKCCTFPSFMFFHITWTSSHLPQVQKKKPTNLTLNQTQPNGQPQPHAPPRYHTPCAREDAKVAIHRHNLAKLGVLGEIPGFWNQWGKTWNLFGINMMIFDRSFHVSLSWDYMGGKKNATIIECI